MKVDEVLKIFGENVRKQREKTKMSIKELSSKTKIRKEYLMKIECGEAKGLPCYYILLLAKALSIKPQVLCDGI